MRDIGSLKAVRYPGFLLVGDYLDPQALRKAADLMRKETRLN